MATFEYSCVKLFFSSAVSPWPLGQSMMLCRENPLPCAPRSSVSSAKCCCNKQPGILEPTLACGVSLLGSSPRCSSSTQWPIPGSFLLDDSATLGVLPSCCPRWVREGISGARTSGENPSTLLLWSVLRHVTKTTAVVPGAHSCGSHDEK